MTPQLIIFDCDGVLVDSERIAIRIDAQVYGSIGCPITEEEIIRLFVGRSDSEMNLEIERRLGRKLPANFDELSTPLYREAFKKELKPVAGIPELLRDLKLGSCVASSGTHEKMQFTLGLTGLYHFFEGRIFSALEVERGKPAPDLFLYAAKQMDVDPSACIVIEDSPYGIEAAIAAGMRAFAYSGGVVPRSRLERPGVTVFESMYDLPGLIGEI
jgi:HAD superfamily hydrolase (TIGR01509 family)